MDVFYCFMDLLSNCWRPGVFMRNVCFRRLRLMTLEEF